MILLKVHTSYVDEGLLLPSDGQLIRECRLEAFVILGVKSFPTLCAIAETWRRQDAF